MARYRYLFAVLLLIAGGLLLYGRLPASESSKEDVSGLLAQIEKQSGTSILIGDPAAMKVGGSQQSVASLLPGVSLEPVSRDHLQPTLEGIAKSLSLYPDHLFARLCPAIILASHIKFDGVDGGGTDGPNFIVLVSNADYDQKTNFDTARLGVHHEFSSIIWQRQPTIAMRWGLLMPPGWQPDPTAAAAIGQYGKSDPAPETGILTAYGATSTENDFNTYAETTVSDPERMRKLAAATPIVATKLSLLMEAYIATDPGFRVMFEKLGYKT
ncbi:hypothetical protein [Oryzifoliimicrobium ureilyticus]|uniref:hypothetical protein n=1 Tax=Oryzifoliimicrobium ureilyticus TaxID=3113724 RepID=UPI00307610B4